MDKLIIKNHEHHSFCGSQNLCIIVATEAHAELTFDLVGEKNITVIVKKNGIYKGVIKTNHPEGNFKHSIILEEENAQGSLCARIYAQGSEEHLLDVVQHHKAPHTVSSVDIRTVLEGKARTFYKGCITIEKHAHGVEAFQEHKTLLMSSEAQAISIPTLQVLNNDVRCGHGSAIAHCNEEYLFYLMSRGISRKDAETCIIKEFLRE